MKRIGKMWGLAILLLCGMTLPVFAQGVPFVGDNDVKAVYVGEFKNAYIEKADEDNKIPLPDGESITIGGNPELSEDYRLVITVVDAVTQTDAWAVTEGIKSDIRAGVSAGSVCSFSLTKESFLVLTKTQVGENVHIYLEVKDVSKLLSGAALAVPVVKKRKAGKRTEC